MNICVWSCERPTRGCQIQVSEIKAGADLSDSFEGGGETDDVLLSFKGVFRGDDENNCAVLYGEEDKSFFSMEDDSDIV